MKEFIFSVLFYLRSCARNGFAHSFSLFLKEYWNAFGCQQPKHSNQATKLSKVTDSSVCRSNSAYQHKVLRLSFFLREPVKATLRILKKNKLVLQEVETSRNSLLRPAVAAQLGQGIKISQEREIRELFTQDKRSRIVASFHFGNFVYGLHKLLCLQKNTRNTVVLSQSKSTSNYMTNMASAFGKKGAHLRNQVLLEKTDVRDLSEFLRNPDRCLVMFADLPNRFGQTIEIEFLGRKARFSKSIALLSLTNNVPILPVICFHDCGSHQIEIGQQIEPLTRAGETRTDTVNRLTQLQLGFFERFFVRHKEQWRYLNHLPEYFSEGST